MRRPTILLLTFVSTIAFASDCPNGDSLLKNKTPLSQLCPNGFGQFNPGSLQQAIGNQPTNVAMITAAAEQQGVPADLALAVSYHESEGFNSCAGSDTGVKGPMQLTQRTGNGLGYNRDINEQNILGGMQLLKQCDNKCGDTAFSCLSACYNGSPRPGEQAGWASGVQSAYTKLHNDPSLLASATSKCSSSDQNPSCPDTAGGVVASSATAPGSATTLPSLGAPPAVASSDILVASTQI
jgi:Transglycosylase SLT domain